MITDNSPPNTTFGHLTDIEQGLVNLLLDVVVYHPYATSPVVSRIHKRLEVELGKEKPNWDKICKAFPSRFLPD